MGNEPRRNVTRIPAVGWSAIALIALLCVAFPRSPEAAFAKGQEGNEIGRVSANDLDEVSGLAASRKNPGILWMHNDGDSRQVFAVTGSGEVDARVNLLAEVLDLEDIALGYGPTQDVDYLYLGDIGDNEEDRREIRVYRFPEPAAERGRGEIVATGIEEFRLAYPDGPHNAEALLVDPITGDLFIATKEKKRTRLYVARAASLKDAAAVKLEKFAALDVAYISGGDISRDGSRLILRRESRGWLWQRRSGESIAEALKRPPQSVSVRTKKQGQNGEAIAFDPEGQNYYTISEGGNEVISVFPIGSGSAD